MFQTPLKRESHNPRQFTLDSAHVLLSVADGAWRQEASARANVA